MVSVDIVVASHKAYKMPSDACYLPLEVGAALREQHVPRFQRDDSGISVSEKNGSYCELTGLYWAWKNLDSDIKGLVHYRRHFEGSGVGKKRQPISRVEIENALESVDLLLPKKRNYLWETNYSHYIHAHTREPLEECRLLLKESWPEYGLSFEDVLARHSAHMFNMMVANRNVFDQYCEWLFSVLIALESRVDLSALQGQEQRVFGYISEILLDTWIGVNNVRYVEVDWYNVEGEKWLRKAPLFVYRYVRGITDRPSEDKSKAGR